MLVPRPTKLRSQRDINLWRIPLFLSLGALGLFGLTMIPDVLDKVGVIHLPWWLTMGGIDDARAILSATMGAVATVLALIFSVALLVLSMVATQFGPRLLYRFLQDWVTQVTIGLFMGTFIYICLVFLVTHQDATSSFIPQVSLITGWVLVVGSFGFLVYYSHRIASSIQNPDLVARIADDIYPAAAGALVRADSEGTGPVPDDDAIARAAARGATVACAKSGYLQHVDHAALVAEAQRIDAKLIIQFRPGQFVLRGEPLAAVVPAEHGPALEAAIQKAVRIGQHRTLTQDSEFGIAQIVEIAIRALRPRGQRHLHRCRLRGLARGRAPRARRKAAARRQLVRQARELRVWMPAVRLERLVRLAFDQIRQAAAQTPAVLIRQLEVIRRLAPRMPEAVKQTFADQADTIREMAAVGCVALDRRDVDSAWRRARTVLDSKPPAAA